MANTRSQFTLEEVEESFHVAATILLGEDESPAAKKLAGFLTLNIAKFERLVETHFTFEEVEDAAQMASTILVDDEESLVAQKLAGFIVLYNDRFKKASAS